ncbi:segment polarity protein dishevelled homolog DVL-3-like isoform X2 [Mizuhopecten yessoensis]|uniref:segment polarity protein dishevelled homolog DVL-3-like isoform X2 n=1 Tax=Mizuhopecten yessoensis TaxID=6573 RepID=UPI000B45D1C9|nr:segment polarity protein dishevelled homolog DVL-3-like isoform X2 [Mizuhopecten yessoensis]
MEETKIIYYIDDEDTPYLIKLPIPADRVTLGDFKNALNRPNYKFFFKSVDDDFGVVKEEIIDDETRLPCFNGRVVSWLVPAESSTSDTQSQCTDSQSGDVQMPSERLGGIGDSRPPSFHANASVVSRDQSCDTCTETDSVLSSRRDRPRSSRHTHNSFNSYRDRRNHNDPNAPPRINGHSKHHRDRGHAYDSSTVLSSDIDTTSFFDSEDDSRFSTVTDTTNRSSKYGRHRRRRRKHRLPPISRASSFSSITDSTMSLNIITVTLNMDTVNFLGISIVGQSNKGGDGGIYVGSIMKGGAVAQDGRVEPGDMILEVNGVSFENMSNDDAVRALREAVQKPGPITLVVAKCWDPNPKGYFTVPRQEPVRPIDPSAWVAHTTAMRGDFLSRGGPSPSLSNMTSTSSSLTSSIPESERFDDLNLTINTDMATVVKAMAQPDSGLEIRDRMWLKITIPNAFIGSDLVDWLFTHVDGFADRRDARKYGCNLLKAGYIRHTVNKITFSEQCYYVFGDLYGNGPVYPDLSTLSLEDVDSVSEADRDTLAPLPPPHWNNQYPYGNTSYLPTNLSYIPPYSYTSTDSQSYVGSFVDGMDKSVTGGGGNNSAGSVHSASVHNACSCLPVNLPAAQRLLSKTLCIESAEPNNNVRGKKSVSKSPATVTTVAMKTVDTATVATDDRHKCKSAPSPIPPVDGPGSSASGSSRKEKEKSDRKSGSPAGSGGSDTETASLASARRVQVVPAPPSTNMMPPNMMPPNMMPPNMMPPNMMPPNMMPPNMMQPNMMPPNMMPPNMMPGQALPPPPRDLSNMPQDLSGSRQSFKMAMGNPCDSVIDS